MMSLNRCRTLLCLCVSLLLFVFLFCSSYLLNICYVGWSFDRARKRPCHRFLVHARKGIFVFNFSCTLWETWCTRICDCQYEIVAIRHIARARCNTNTHVLQSIRTFKQHTQLHDTNIWAFQYIRAVCVCIMMIVVVSFVSTSHNSKRTKNNNNNKK